MDFNLLDLYERASAWTGTKVRVAVAQLDAPTALTVTDDMGLFNRKRSAFQFGL